MACLGGKVDLEWGGLAVQEQRDVVLLAAARREPRHDLHGKVIK